MVDSDNEVMHNAGERVRSVDDVKGTTLKEKKI